MEENVLPPPLEIFPILSGSQRVSLSKEAGKKKGKMTVFHEGSIGSLEESSSITLSV